MMLSRWPAQQREMQVANDVASANELPSREARPGRRVNNSPAGRRGPRGLRTRALWSVVSLAESAEFVAYEASAALAPWSAEMKALAAARPSRAFAILVSTSTGVGGQRACVRLAVMTASRRAAAIFKEVSTADCSAYAVRALASALEACSPKMEASRPASSEASAAAVTTPRRALATSDHLKASGAVKPRFLGHFVRRTFNVSLTSSLTSHFEINGYLFRQERGVAMGSPAAPPLDSLRFQMPDFGALCRQSLHTVTGRSAIDSIDSSPRILGILSFSSNAGDPKCLGTCVIHPPGLSHHRCPIILLRLKAFKVPMIRCLLASRGHLGRGSLRVELSQQSL